jgi:hypothetical protein
MIELKIKGKIKEIDYMGEKSCLFVLEGEQGDILGTIAGSSRMHKLSEFIEVGKQVEVDGFLEVYRRTKGDSVYRSNTFNVIDIKGGETYESRNKS